MNARAALEVVLAGLADTHAPSVPWATRTHWTENNVDLPPGDGAWQTVEEIDRLGLWIETPDGASVMGILREGTDWSPFMLRIAVDADGLICEGELVVIRAKDAAGAFHNADIQPRSEFIGSVAPERRTSAEEMIELVDGYFATLQQNTGELRTRFHPDCRRRENGVWTTQNTDPNAPPTMRMSCAASFELGFFRGNERVRGRRYPLVDVESGLVLAGAFIDHSGRLKEYTLTDGQNVAAGFQRPHTYAMLEAFRIEGGQIAAIEAVFHPVPYRMRAAWPTVDADARVDG